MENKENEFLIKSKRTADPFGRLNNITEPVLALIEFCQIIGPRCVKTVPNNLEQTPYLDMDAIALWLMSCEAAPGTVLIIFNQQIGIHAVSYYTMLYDVRARAFQRFVCVSYIMSSRPSTDIITRFTEAVRKLLVPLVGCNRRMFLNQLSVIQRLSNAVENNTVQQYYSFYNDDSMNLVSSMSNKIASVAEQAKKLGPAIRNMYDSLQKCSFKDVSCSGHLIENSTESELQTILNQFSRSDPLRDIKDICPCTYDNFINDMQTVHLALKRKPFIRGVLFSSNIPVLRVPKFESPVKEKSPDEKTKQNIELENNLVLTTPFLDQMLYPVLSGDTVVICGSEQRRNVVMELVHVFNRLIPKAHTNRNLVLWSNNDDSEEGVIGMHLKKGTSLKPSLSRFSTLNLNENVFHCFPYQGNLLSKLSIKRTFPSDAILVKYLAVILTWICSYVYVCRFVGLQSISKQNELSLEDQRIIAQLLCEIDVLKFGGLRSNLDRKKSGNSVRRKIDL